MKRSLAPLVVLAVALAVIVFVAVATPASNGDDLDPSSIGSGRAGTLALYTWLGNLGLDVHRTEGSLDLQGTDVLISVAPEVAWTDQDVVALMQHLDSGGDAVISSSDPVAVAPLLQRLHVAAGQPFTAAAVAPLLPFDVSGAVRSVPLRSPTPSADPFRPAAFGFDTGNPGLVPLLGNAVNPVAAGVRVGGGHLWLVGSVFPFSNDGLRSGDSAVFILSLLERARGGHVTFDEFHHNLGAESSSFGIGEVFRGPLLLATLLGVAVLVGFIASSGRRLGRPLPARSAARVPTALDDIDSMAQLFARSEQRGAVARRYADEVKQRLGGVTGVDAHLPDADFIAAIGGYGSGRTAAAAQLLADCRALAAGRPGEAQLVDLARRADSVEREWSGETA